MCYHPRIEETERGSLTTSRSRNSELWFINNQKLEHTILGYVAKYQQRYDVTLYALAIEGNHMHTVTAFPKKNRADFMRDLNSSIARAIPRHCENYPGGTFWARRYSQEFLPGSDDIEEYFFYAVLQPVRDGLVQRISDYPGYNCFHDAINGIKRPFEVVRWGEYNSAKRWNPDIKVKDYTDTVLLEYSRLPGYEELSKQEYVKLMNRKLEDRRSAIVAERTKQGLGFVGREALLRMTPGALPQNSKSSELGSHRPRVLCVCPKRKEQELAWYFNIYFEFKEASYLYRSGDLSTVFPEGTYKPYIPPPPG